MSRRRRRESELTTSPTPAPRTEVAIPSQFRRQFAADSGVEAQRERKYSLRAVIMLIGLMMVAAALGVIIFTHTSMRLDEAQSLFQVSRDIPGLLNLVGQDVHVPGYHILLHYWLIIFGSYGDQIVIARYMSLIFMVALIPSIYILIRQIFNRRIAMFAAILVSISPFLQWYGSEARMYSMLALITVLHQIVFLKLFRKGHAAHWVWFVVTAIIGLYTHYFFGFVLLTEAVFFLFYRKKFLPGSFQKFIVAAILAIGALTPWLLYVRSLGLASNTQPYLPVPSSGDLFNTYAQFIFGFQVNNLNTIIVSVWPIIVLFAFWALRKNHRTSPELFFFVLAAVLPVVGAFVISILIKPFFLSRYLVVSLPALFVLISWFASIYPRVVRRIVQTGLIGLTIVLLCVEIISPNTPVKEDYKQAVGYLYHNASSQDVIVATAPFTIYPIEYYYGNGPAKLTTQPIWNRFEQGSVPAFNPAKLPAETKENVTSYQHAWLVLSYDQGYNQKMLKYYDSHYERLSMKKFSPGLVVYEYKLRYDPGFKIE